MYTCIHIYIYMQFNFWGGRYIYAEYDYTMDPDSF